MLGCYFKAGDLVELWRAGTGDLTITEWYLIVSASDDPLGTVTWFLPSKGVVTRAVHITRPSWAMTVIRDGKVL